MSKIKVIDRYKFYDKYYPATGFAGIPRPMALFEKLVREHGKIKAHKITEETYGYQVKDDK